MKKLNILIMVLSFVSLSNCAHITMRGSVAMKTSQNEAHVCLGKGEVKVGDRVVTFKNICVGQAEVTNSNYHSGSRTGAGACEKKEMGMGTVEEILNDHYSVVKFDPGVIFEEGTIVEKM